MRVRPEPGPLALMVSADPVLIYNPSCSARKPGQAYGSSGLVLLAITFGYALCNLCRAPSGEVNRNPLSFSRAAAD